MFVRVCVFYMLTFNLIQYKHMRSCVAMCSRIWPHTAPNNSGLIISTQNTIHRATHSHIPHTQIHIVSTTFTLDISDMVWLYSTHTYNIYSYMYTYLFLYIRFFFPLFSVCNQFSRGVYSMLGAVSPDSFDTLHSYSNTFQMPFVTPWFPEKVSNRVLSCYIMYCITL